MFCANKMQHLNIKAGGFLTKVNHTAAQVTPAFHSREGVLEFGFTIGNTVAAVSALRTGNRSVSIQLTRFYCGFRFKCSVRK